MERGVQQNDSLADGYSGREVAVGDRSELKAGERQRALRADQQLRA